MTQQSNHSDNLSLYILLILAHVGGTEGYRNLVYCLSVCLCETKFTKLPNPVYQYTQKPILYSICDTIFQYNYRSLPF